MKQQKYKRQSSDRNTDKIVAFVCLAILFIILLVAKASGTTYFKFTYPSPDGVSGRFVVTNEASGDSTTGGILTETERAALTYWKGSALLDPGSYTVEGFIFEGSDTSIASYRVDIYPQAINDTVLLLQDSLEALEAWVAHQTTVDSIQDSLEAQDGWMAHQTTVDSLWDSLLALQDTTEAALSNGAIGDKVWIDASSRTLSAYRWTIAERDSILAALTDAAIGDKVWTDATTRSVTESVTVDVSDAMTTGGLISKIEDTIYALKADYKATGYSTHNAADIWTSATRALTSYIWSTAEKDSVISSLADAVLAEKVWEYDSSSVSSSGGMGQMLKDTIAYQGSAAGLTAGEVADSVWNRDTSDHSTAASYGVIIKDTSAYQGGAAGLTASEVADTVWNRDTSDQSTAASYGVILKDTSAYQGAAAGLTAAEVADSVWDEDTTGHYDVGTYGYEATGGGEGSDTTAILAMLFNNLFCRVATDTPIVVWNDGKIKLSDADHAAIEDSVHANAADYKATGYSSHNAADVWSAVGGDSVLNTIEDANKVNFMADVSALSSHSVLDVYNQFIAGANEEIFWIPKSDVADTTWKKFNDGSNEDNFKADISLLALQSEVINLDGWNPITDNDSLIVDMSSLSKRPVIGDTIQRDASIFVPASDSVIVDVSSAITAGGLVPNIEDSVHANAADYKATEFSMHSAADVWTATGGDSILNALEDANKDNFKADTNRIIAIVDSILDSLQSQDDWGAHQSTVDSAVDTSAATYAKANSCLDSLQVQDDWITHQTTSDSLYDSLLIILDSLEALESWVAQQTEVANLNGWAPIIDNDSLIIDISSLIDKLWEYDTSSISAGIGQMLKDTSVYQGSAAGLTIQQIVDGVWNEDTTGHNTSQSFGLMLKDTLVYQGGATSAWSTAQRDSVLAALSDNAIDDKVWTDASTRTITDKSGFSLTAEERGHIEDSIYAHAANYKADVAALIDTCNAVIDSLQNWYDEVAAINNIVDSLYAVLDTIQNQDDWIGTVANQELLLDSLYAALDSLQNQDDWVASHSASDVWSSATRTLSSIGIDAFWDEDTTGHGTASSFAVMLKDTNAYQGAAAGLTAIEISDSVWEKTQSAYTTIGTFGYNLDATISSVDASGSGAYAFNVVVVDSGAATDSVIPDARVYVNNQDQSATPYWAITDNGGIAAFQINAGTWVRFTTEPGFAQNLDTFTNSGSATETLYVYCDAGSKTTIAFELGKPTDVRYSLAKININLVAENDSLLRIDDTIIVSHANYEIRATANSEGLASINLYPNSDYTNDSTYYRCIIRDQHNRLIVDRFKFRVPDTSAVMRYQDLTRWQ